MRIGEFSKKHNVSQDTIRHYMELELILPERIGGHYHFNARCSADLEEIKWLKQVGFSLAEIQKIFSLMRLTNLVSEEDRDHYIAFLKQKAQTLFQEQKRLEDMIRQIEHKISIIENTSIHHSHRQFNEYSGVPLGFLAFLACPECHSSLQVSAGRIEANTVKEGELKCHCGFLAHIQDGIIIVKNLHYQNPQRDLSGSTTDYIEATSHEFINLVYRGCEWIMKSFHPSSHDIILELGTGDGLFLRQAIQNLPNHGYYIVTDQNFKLVKQLKADLDLLLHGKCVFICADFLSLPLKNECIDIVVDFIGSTSFNLKRPQSLIKSLSRVVKPHGKWLGVHFHFHHHSKSLKEIDAECRPYLELPRIQREIESSPFSILKQEDLGFADQAGQTYEPFLKPGDKVYQWGFVGEKA